MALRGLAELQPDTQTVDGIYQVEAILDEHDDGVVTLRLRYHYDSPQADVGHIYNIPKHPLLHISQGHQYLADDIKG